MKVRNKILIYFATTIILVSGLSLALIYGLFTAYREEAFQKTQFRKVRYTLGLLREHKEQSEQLSKLLDDQDIQDFYDEKLLIFDQDKILVFSSIDSLPIANVNALLTQLSPARTWIETKDEEYDVIAVYVEQAGQGYYAISKAYDQAGYAKNKFLAQVLWSIFLLFSILVLILARYLSNIIARPITALAKDLNTFDLSEKDFHLLELDSSTYELQELKNKFNELLLRSHEYLKFQQNTVHHISHELKTPIAILVSELEKIRNENGPGPHTSSIDALIRRAASLGDIISALLQISKLESGQELGLERFRIDEVLFDIIGELSTIGPAFSFEVSYIPEFIPEELLTVSGNRMLIKQALMNLLLNAMNYASEPQAKIAIRDNAGGLMITISNKGALISAEDQQYIFQYFFRGSNSQHTAGFGLGLVLTQRILAAHGADINYGTSGDDTNIFTLRFLKPLS